MTMRNYSNNIKVALFADNVLEQLALRRTESIVVQHYGYALERPRNDHGIAYGTSSGGILTIDVRIASRDNMRTYYERLSQNYSTAFSLVFNATYDEFGILENYDGGMIVEGYLIGIGENFDRDKAEEQGEQMKLRFKVLVTKMTCIGLSHNITHHFSN